MKTPNYIQADAVDITIKAASADSKQKVPTFEMLAYNGGMMNLAFWDYPVVVEISGTKYDIPLEINYQHDSWFGVGHATDIKTDNNTISASGVISRENIYAKDVAQSGINGYPWQASIGAIPDKIVWIPEDVTVVANGQTFTGPLYHVTESTLQHISFVEKGADSDTSASIAAMAAHYNTHSETSNMADKTKEPQKTVEAAKVEVKPLKTEAPVVEASKSTETVTPVQQMRIDAAAEVTRIADISKVCKDPDIQAKAIAEGWTADQAELEELRAGKAAQESIQAGRPSPNIIIPKSGDTKLDAKSFEINTMRAAGVKSSLIEAKYTPEQMEAADSTRRMGLTEMLEAASGDALGRFPRGAMEQKTWLQAAFSTVSLPGILSNVANKTMLSAYMNSDRAWAEIAKIGSVNDFKRATRLRMTDDFKFKQVAPGGEIKHGKVSEISYGNQADTYGITFSISRQMLINDDLGAFAQIPSMIGMGAADSINEAFWKIWNDNANDLFSLTQTGGNANQLEGTDYVLSVGGLTALETLFENQIKPNGSPLGATASILLVPSALKRTGMALMSSQTVNETTTANKPKPVNNTFVNNFKLVSTNYLSNSTISDNASSTAYYLLADPSRIPAIEVAFLNGVQAPTIERADADFDQLGIQMRGYFDYGIEEQDFRGVAQATGVAAV